jgi:3-hydroxyisobutyrate dehydrogenase-like beta-hydroxyacid dehydrogenase
MDAQGESHLLEHVAVVVDAGLAKADRHAHAAGAQRVERRDAAAQAEIRVAIVTDGCAWLAALFNPSIR